MKRTGSVQERRHFAIRRSWFDRFCVRPIEVNQSRALAGSGQLKFALPANGRCTQCQDETVAALPIFRPSGSTAVAEALDNVSHDSAVLARGLKMSVRRDQDARIDR